MQSSILWRIYQGMIELVSLCTHLHWWWQKLPVNVPNCPSNCILYNLQGKNYSVLHKNVVLISFCHCDKNNLRNLVQWHKPIIPATWKVEAEESQVQTQPGQFNNYLSQNFKAGGAGDMAYCKDPGFIPQYWEEKKYHCRRKVLVWLMVSWLHF